MIFYNSFERKLLGYARVILAIVAFYYISIPKYFLPLYGLSCLLDVADGYAARLLNQCNSKLIEILKGEKSIGSRFGAVLDMVTDRSTTAGLLCHLCIIYPRLTLGFQLLIALDLSSHYMQMYSALSSGATSHKSIEKGQNFLLRLYYTSRTVLFIACALNESFFMSLYMLSHHPGPFIHLFGYSFSLWLAFATISAPICLFKQVMNVIQLFEASIKLAELDSQAISIKNKKE